MQVKPPVLAAAALVALAAAVASAAGSPSAPPPTLQARERAATPPGMVYVPGGWCLLGTDDPDADDDARPLRRVFVPSFYLDRHEVTNAEYRRFRASHTFPAGEDDFPVTGVSYEDAEAYSRALGKRLPTETEWEKAARGTDGRRYPWGSTWDPERVAPRARRAERAPALEPGCPYSRVQPVGSRPRGASPYGALDMAGNAWEWVQGFYRGNPDQRIIRGGAVGYGERSCRTYQRGVEGSGVT